MSISLYFGLPGCGKTTLLTALALHELNKSNVLYQHVYGNVHLALPGYTYIDNSCVGKYDLCNSIIFIDESTLFANSREYMQFSKELLQFMVMHRHYNVDIVFFSQRWDSMDKNIRTITDRVYYVYKPKLTGRWITKYYRIPYGIIIPSGKKADGEKLGEIVQGYCKPDLLTRILAHRLWRPRYYKYFDSWEHPPLPKLPKRYVPYPDLRTSESCCGSDQSEAAPNVV